MTAENKTNFTLREFLEPWLVWLTVTGLAWMGGLILAPVIQLGLAAILPGLISALLALFLGGGLLGLIQYSYLPNTGKRAGLWLLSSGLGWTGGLWLANLPVMLSPAWLGGLLGGLIGGAWMGALQSFVLLNAADRKRWRGETISGWMLSFFLGTLLLPRAVQPPGLVDLLEVGSPGGLGWVFAAMAGVFGLLFFFPPRKPQKQHEDEGQDQENKPKM